MIRRLARSVRQLNAPTGFDSYLRDLQRNSHSGTPTETEAKREFREYTSHRTKLGSYFEGIF